MALLSQGLRKVVARKVHYPAVASIQVLSSTPQVIRRGLVDTSYILLRVLTVTPASYLRLSCRLDLSGSAEKLRAPIAPLLRFLCATPAFAEGLFLIGDLTRRARSKG